MTTSAEIIGRAWRLHLAVPAFNVPYLPMVEPIIRAVAAEDSFALLEVARVEWEKFGAHSPAAVMEEFACYADPRHVRIHLDHVPVIDEDGATVDYRSIIRDSLALGYQSVMVDGSRLPLRENIAATREIVERAHEAGVACEAELGAVFGHEDGPLPDYDELFRTGLGFTRPDEAATFARESGCDWLSIAFGNVHGAVAEAARDREKVSARLALDHLKKIADVVELPLVLHGGSGIAHADLVAAIRGGIVKINVGTEIRQAFERTLRGADREAAMEAVYERTVALIRDRFSVSGTRELLAS
jgi:ketose-bisphosphate aldolase